MAAAPRRAGRTARRGPPYIDFDRDAASLGEAILSAVRDVEKVEGCARLVSAGEAERLGRPLVFLALQSKMRGVGPRAGWPPFSARASNGRDGGVH